MKIDIPESVQDVLRCDECNELLSCGPVYLLHDKSVAICGRCSVQPPLQEQHQNQEEKNKYFVRNSEIESQSRNVQYEAAAQLLWFPCSFAHQGCLEKMEFSADEPNIHERDCAFRTFICPIAPRGSCDWVGSRQKLSEHCREAHPEHLFENPCLLPRPNLTTSYLSNYLVSAFNLLFLVHLKVCVASGKLFHSVRMFGDSKLLEKFSYSLQIEGNNKILTEYGLVLRTGILALQEPSAISTSINSLLDLLDGKYNESKLTITIQTSLKFNCVNCSKNIISDSKFCEECQEKVVKCKFNEKGCLFVDINNDKCWKHENMFCEYQTKCWITNCKVDFVGGSLIEHLASSASHKIKKTIINSVVRVTDTKSDYNYILFSSNNIRIIIAKYALSNSIFRLFLWTSLPSYELKNLKCSIEITDPQTKQTKILTPQIIYNNWPDWDIYEKMDNFPSWKTIGIDINVNIDKM